MTSPFLDARTRALACLTLAAWACSDQPIAPDAAARQMTFQGTFAVAARLPDGTVETAERPWSAVASVSDLGAYSRAVTKELADDPRVYQTLREDERPAPFPLLALGSGHHLAQWRSSRPVISRFAEGGKDYVLAIERATTVGPPTQVTLFEGGRPSTVVKLEWQKEGDLWIAARTAVTIWKDGTPAAQLVARVSGTERRLAAAVEAQSMLEHATDAVQSLILPAMSAIFLPATAEAQLHFWACRYVWLDVMKNAAIMVASLASAGSVSALVQAVAQLGFVTAGFDVVDAILKLLDCVKEQENSGGTPVDTGASPPPPLGLTATDHDLAWVRDLLAGRDRVCASESHATFCT